MLESLNPFQFAVPPRSADPVAASSPPAPLGDAAAELSLADLMARGFDPEAFISDIEPLPAFLVAPRPEYLQAAELMPVLAALAGH